MHLGTSKMDSSAVYQKYKNKIREIRQKVEEYEQKLLENAKEIERE